jgi:hypothetical protein
MVYITRVVESIYVKVNSWNFDTMKILCVSQIIVLRTSTNIGKKRKS